MLLLARSDGGGDGLYTFVDGQVIYADEMNANFDYLDARSNVAGRMTMITATVTGPNGGQTVVSCPAGYSLIFYALSDVRLTESGTYGWPIGTFSCSSSGSALIATLMNYQDGTDATMVTCNGLCVEN